MLKFWITECRAAADILHGIVKSVGVEAYESAQKKACTCIPDDKTMSTQLIKSKKNEIDTEQSKSIFQNIFDNLSEMFWKFFDLLKSSPIVQSAISIVKSVINFFRGICESFFGVTPLNSEAGWMDILSFLKQCIVNAYESFVVIKGLIEGRDLNI